MSDHVEQVNALMHDFSDVAHGRSNRAIITAAANLIAQCIVQERPDADLATTLERVKDVSYMIAHSIENNWDRSHAEMAAWNNAQLRKQ